MRIFTAQSLINNSTSFTCKTIRTRPRQHRPAFVLVEVVVTLALVGIFLTLASVNLMGYVLEGQFKAQASEFINVLKMAQNAAAKGNQRFAIVIDFDEQTYTMIPFSTIDKEQIWAEEIPVRVGSFSENFQIDYVFFDDAVDTRQWNLEQTDYFRVWLMAGHSGWQNGAKIVVLDRHGNPYSIIVNRLSKDIKLVKGDAEMLAPLENVVF